MKLVLILALMIVSASSFADTFKCHGVQGTKANFSVSTDGGAFRIAGTAQFPSNTRTFKCKAFQSRNTKYGGKTFLYQDFSEKCPIGTSRMKPDFETSAGFIALVDEHAPADHETLSTSEYAYAYCER